MLKYFIALSLLLSFSNSEARKKKPSQIQNFSGTVEKCHDGDTCRVLVDGKSLKIRFAGIDTPEISKKHGKEAQRFTESLIKGKNVDLKCEGKSFDRLTCDVYHQSLHINAEIVKNGWAYDSTKYSKGRYKEHMVVAQAQKSGIWREGGGVRIAIGIKVPNPAATIPPSCHRG